MEPMKIKCSAIFGSSEIKMFDKFENGRMVSYGYSISYDGAGNETGRTDPTVISSIGWDDGSPFAKADMEGLRGH
jgi:hypothetical protein